MKEKILKMVNKTKFQISKHSPELLIAAGLTGTVIGTVLACKATIKAKDVINENKCLINKIHKWNELPSEQRDEEYTEKDYKKDLTIAYTNTSIKLFKLYMPAIGITALSFSSILKGHNVLVKRNLALAAAYTTIDKGFKKYRSNVVERFGEQVDKELRYNIKADTQDTKNKSKNKKGENENNLNKVNMLECSDYARFFDSTSAEFQKDPEYNLMFLRRQQEWANEKLKAQGYLFLNDVYEMLDIPKSKAGQIVGWIYDPNNEKGDNYIDFGIYKDNEATNRFVNGLEYNILLDFNVDGPIYNILEA